MGKSFVEDGLSKIQRHPVVERLSTDREEKDQRIPNFPDVQGKPARETKDRRFQLMLRSSTYKILEREAKAKEISVNETINQILDIYISAKNAIGSKK
ncbi:MAG: hypothetical protein Nk1A_7150 [Endomicrobiia bacterium]|nr:MAG: hypothetical protein Nk1A_7150 [Endomicrobiia bacterium]